MPTEFQDSVDKKRKFFHEVAYETSDIDLFIYGLPPEGVEDKASKRVGDNL